MKKSTNFAAIAVLVAATVAGVKNSLRENDGVFS